MCSEFFDVLIDDCRTLRGKIQVLPIPLSAQVMVAFELATHTQDQVERHS